MRQIISATELLHCTVLQNLYAVTKTKHFANLCFLMRAYSDERPRMLRVSPMRAGFYLLFFYYRDAYIALKSAMLIFSKRLNNCL